MKALKFIIGIILVVLIAYFSVADINHGQGTQVEELVSYSTEQDVNIYSIK